MAINANGINIKNCGAGLVALEGGKIYADGANLSDCGIGAMADSKSEININNANLENCEIAILDLSSNLMQQLKDNKINIKDFVEMLEALKTSTNKEETIKKYGFFDFINNIQALDYVREKFSDILTMFN